MTNLNYYKVLRLRPEATPKEIDKAFSNLRLLFDESKERNAKEIMEIVDKVYYVLRDPIRRAEYDMDEVPRIVDQSRDLSEAEKIIASWQQTYTTEEQLYLEKVHTFNRVIKILITIWVIIFLGSVITLRFDIAATAFFMMLFTRRIIMTIYLIKNPPPEPEVWGAE